MKITDLDSTNLNQKDNVVYELPPGAKIDVNKPQTITKKGVRIIGNGAVLNCGAGWEQTQLTFKGSDCGVEGVVVRGHDGGEFVGLVKADRFQLRDVTQVVSKTNGGIGVIVTNGSNGLEITNLITERTARYSIYLGDSSKYSNTGFKITKCTLGPTKLVEDRKYNGRGSKVLSEHCMRAYGIVNGIIDTCNMSNYNNPDGKQALKAMNGLGLVVLNSDFDGTRWGRDINDPSSYRLDHVTVTHCFFKEWFRVDTGTTMVVNESTFAIDSAGCILDVQGTGRITVRNINAKYKNNKGKFSNKMSAVTLLGENWFNGKKL